LIFTYGNLSSRKNSQIPVNQAFGRNLRQGSFVTVLQTSTFQVLLKRFKKNSQNFTNQKDRFFLSFKALVFAGEGVSLGRQANDLVHWRIN
jgi:hypothetical protein